MEANTFVIIIIIFTYLSASKHTEMEFRSATVFAAIAAIALMVDSSFAFGYLDGFGYLQNFYEVASPSAALPPAPAPAMPFAMPLPMSPMLYAPPPPPMALPAPPPPPAPQAPPGCPGCCEKGCCGHPSCLSFLKPCIHAKLLNLKKKLLEKKLSHLLACCTQYNSHLCHQPC